MLVLSRKEGESILIGSDIELTVLECHGGDVKLGIRAPRDVVILRKEIQDAVRGENIAASSLPENKRIQEVVGEWAKKLKKDHR